MTTYGSENIVCSLCGGSSEQRVLTSTNSFGSPDLDLRPREMQRSTMSCWLQECPSCGFVSADLSKPEEGARGILASPVYLSLRSGRPSRALIDLCLKRSHLDEYLGNTAGAAEHALWAAWAADDADDPSAREYRSKAADLLILAISGLPADSLESIEMRTRTVDILRRAGRWREAIDLADKILAVDIPNPTIRSVVEFERVLAGKQEGSTYTVQDALSDSAAK